MDRHDKYDDYVSHPRYGKGPRFSGVEPVRADPGYRQMGLNSYPAVPGTAVEADLERQSPSPVPIAYYFDADRLCRDCGRPFLFFAEEQKYWYEELRFPLDSDCVRCFPCRKHQQVIAKTLSRYEQLVTSSNRTIDESAELGESCLTLIEEGIFPRQRLETVRMILNRLRKLDALATDSRYTAIATRLATLEQQP
jgi:hypothetical protein